MDEDVGRLEIRKRLETKFATLDERRERFDNILFIWDMLVG